MKKLLYVLGLTFAITLNSFALTNNTININDSLKNEITFSQDRLGYNSYSFKYNHKITSNLWLKIGLVSFGDYLKSEPKNDNTGFTSSDKENSFGLILGLDNHSNTLIKGLECIYGFHFRLFYSQNKRVIDNPILPIEYRTSVNHALYSGLGISFGLYYNISKKFAIGSEINPYFDYVLNNNNNDSGFKEWGYNYDIFGNISIISIKYRW